MSIRGRGTTLLISFLELCHMVKIRMEKGPWWQEQAQEGSCCILQVDNDLKLHNPSLKIKNFKMRSSSDSHLMNPMQIVPPLHSLQCLYFVLPLCDCRIRSNVHSWHDARIAHANMPKNVVPAERNRMFHTLRHKKIPFGLWRNASCIMNELLSTRNATQLPTG